MEELPFGYRTADKLKCFKNTKITQCQTSQPGAHADSHKWPGKYDEFIIGTVLQYENGAGKLRRFLAFSDYSASIMVLAECLHDRGIYIRSTTYKIVKMTVSSPAELVLAYTREWVTRNPKAILNLHILKAVASLYNEVEKQLI